MKKTVLREYARMIARVGANVQKGQDVIIHAGLDQPEFVALVVEECYIQFTIGACYYSCQNQSSRYAQQRIKSLCI